jgi:hypothetical protein
VSVTRDCDAAWRRSTSCTSGECFEAASWMGTVMVRNSGQPSATLSFPGSAWRDFTAVVLGARVDHDTNRGMLERGAQSALDPRDQSEEARSRKRVDFEC